MQTTIRIWSATGNTPVTKRAGAYCDELVKVVIDAADPAAAKAAAYALLLSTPHAAEGHFDMPGYWNQNTNSGYVNIRDARRAKADPCKLGCDQISEVASRIIRAARSNPRYLADDADETVFHDIIEESLNDLDGQINDESVEEIRGNINRRVFRAAGLI